MRQIYVVCLF